MSKPLELRIYKIWENSLSGTAYCSAFTSDQDPGYPVNVDLAVLVKRFEDMELVAEWWRESGGSAEVNYSRDAGPGRPFEHIHSILHRFATTPSYDGGDQ
jgi:hypothetical protein